jgi:hypothetical protein
MDEDHYSGFKSYSEGESIGFQIFLLRKFLENLKVSYKVVCRGIPTLAISVFHSAVELFFLGKICKMHVLGSKQRW